VTYDDMFLLATGCAPFPYLVSKRQAQLLGRLGGKASAADRKGNSEWGRRMQRKRAAKAQKRHYPDLVRKWAHNAAYARWGKPLEPVPLVMTPKATADREARQLRKRREQYERDRARGGRRCTKHRDARGRSSSREPNLFATGT
jgi:hypothetical protein